MKRRELTGAYFRFGLEFDVSYNILSHDSQQVKILRYIHVCLACEQARLCELGEIFLIPRMALGLILFSNDN